MRSFQLVYNCVNPFIPAGKVNLYAKIPLCYRRENRNDASNVKMTSPPRVNSRPATSPKELSSPRRPTSRKELERGATQPEIIKSPPRSANAVSTRVYFWKSLGSCFAPQIPITARTLIVLLRTYLPDTPLYNVFWKEMTRLLVSFVRRYVASLSRIVRCCHEESLSVLIIILDFASSF